MRWKLIIGLVSISFSFAVLARANDLSPLIKKLSGSYVHRVVLDVNGKPVSADNHMEILPYKNDLTYFHIFLNFTNAHMCEISGIAKEQDNHLIYSVPNTTNSNENCTFSIGFSNNEITMDDKDAACQHQFCSANGSFQIQQKDQFRIPDRKVIKNLSAIKNSQDYKDAMSEYTTLHP